MESVGSIRISRHGTSGKEWTPLAPGEIVHKYYPPGVGLVFIEELKEKTVMVELVDVY